MLGSVLQVKCYVSLLFEILLVCYVILNLLLFDVMYNIYSLSHLTVK